MEPKPKKRRAKTPDAGQLRDLAREKVPEALEAVCCVLRDEDVKHAERLRAAEIIMDRAYGKTPAKNEAESDVRVVMEGFEKEWAD